MILTQDQGCVNQPSSSSTAVVDRLLLRQVSPRDAKWDDRRAESQRIGELYQGTILDPLAGKIAGCSGRLIFNWDIGPDNKAKIKLSSAWFCRVRTCSVCQWRKSLMWRAKAFKIIPNVVKAYPTHRFIFLTLTIRNCAIADLGATLTKMNKAWMRLTKRKQWPAVGWLRSVEVTRAADGTAHPHFHCLLMVNPSYFSGKSYLSQKTWTDLWQKSLQVDYPPMVDVRAVRAKKGSSDGILDAILETLKYSVKPSDLMGKSKGKETEKDKDWLVELTLQLKNTRSVATGGILKEYLKELENEPEDLIHVDEDGKTDEQGIATVTFDWEQRIQKYVYMLLDE